VGWDWVHLVRRPLTGLLYQPRTIDEECWAVGNENWQGKPKYSEKTCPSFTLPITNPTWLDVGSNTGRRGGKPATNRLSYGTAWHLPLNLLLITINLQQLTIDDYLRLVPFWLDYDYLLLCCDWLGSDLRITYEWLRSWFSFLLRLFCTTESSGTTASLSEGTLVQSSGIYGSVCWMSVYSETFAECSFTRKRLLYLSWSPGIHHHGNVFCTELFPRNGPTCHNVLHNSAGRRKQSNMTKDLTIPLCIVRHMPSSIFSSIFSCSIWLASLGALSKMTVLLCTVGRQNEHRLNDM
jgi:hypothetical protein